MHRISVPVVLFALAACASAKTGGGDEPYVTSDPHDKVVNNGLNGVTVPITSVESKDVMLATILAPVDSVWNVLGPIFLDLGVEPQTVDQPEHFLANTSFQVHGALGGVNVSHYLDCGSNISGSLVNQGSISMSLTVQVVKDSVASSILKSQVDGFAVQRGLQPQKVHCASTGELEARIARMVRDALTHGAKH